MTATSESLSLQGSDGGDPWSGTRLPSEVRSAVKRGGTRATRRVDPQRQALLTARMGPPASRFRILKNHRAETRSQISLPSMRDARISSSETGLLAGSRSLAGRCGTVIAGAPAKPIAEIRGKHNGTSPTTGHDGAKPVTLSCWRRCSSQLSTKNVSTKRRQPSRDDTSRMNREVHVRNL
jgi:hypothetical protein